MLLTVEQIVGMYETHPYFHTYRVRIGKLPYIMRHHASIARKILLVC